MTCEYRDYPQKHQLDSHNIRLQILKKEMKDRMVKIIEIMERMIMDNQEKHTLSHKSPNKLKVNEAKNIEEIMVNL